MAGPTSILDDAGQRARWEGFAWTDANAKAAKEIIAPSTAAEMNSIFPCP